MTFTIRDPRELFLLVMMVCVIFVTFYLVRFLKELTLTLIEVRKLTESSQLVVEKVDNNLEEIEMVKTKVSETSRGIVDQVISFFMK